MSSSSTNPLKFQSQIQNIQKEKFSTNGTFVFLYVFYFLLIYHVLDFPSFVTQPKMNLNLKFYIGGVN